MGERGSIRVLRRSVDALVAATLAPACVVCKTILDAPTSGCVCPACWGAAMPSGHAAAAHAWTTAHITSGISAGRYDGALREIIHAFKYEGRRTLATRLGGFMRDMGQSVLSDCDCVVPVPLHPWRRMRRGFNQARDLAEHLDRPVTKSLWRARATPSQMALAAAERHANVRGAFVVSPFCSALVDDARMVLVDDVRTTGATMDECARVLLAAGAREVRGLTIAFA